MQNVRRSVQPIKVQALLEFQIPKLSYHNVFLRSYLKSAPFLLLLSNSAVHSGAHFLDSLLGVLGAKDGSTSDKDVGTGLGTLASVARSNTTIDLDVLARESLPQLLYLFEAFGHEPLTTSARADGHDEQEIGSFTKGVRDGASRGFR